MHWARVTASLPWPVVVAAFGLLGYGLAGRRVATVAVLGFLFMGVVGLWTESLQTLALMAVSVFIALLIGIPLGIWTARSPTADAVLRPILDGGGSRTCPPRRRTLECEHFAVAAHQQFQQCKLLCGKRNALTCAGDASTHQVKFKISDVKLCLRRRGATPP